jgi:transcriptional regulator GlxA family with amidase domain
MDLTRRQLVGSGVAAGFGVALASSLRSHAAAHADPAPPKPTPEAPLRIQVAVFDGFELTDGLAPYDVLKRAQQLSNGALVATLVSVNGAEAVTALDDVSLKPNAAFDPNADVFAGSRWATALACRSDATRAWWTRSRLFDSQASYS